jgi:signal transduction histidine kinase
VVIEMSPDLPPVDADEHQMVQVFTNLLTNAFEALGGGGRIAIKAVVEAVELDPAFATDGEAPTPTLIVDVTDNGPGVQPELRDRIFDPFFTTKPEGSGLGLPIVRKIVDAHDGRIDLTSTPGLGTRFRVTLPVTNTASWFKSS